MASQLVHPPARARGCRRILFPATPLLDERVPGLVEPRLVLRPRRADCVLEPLDPRPELALDLLPCARVGSEPAPRCVELRFEALAALAELRLARGMLAFQP